VSRPVLPLRSGEVVCWEARPAPRCYTFRNWRHSLFGLTILLLAAAWLAVGYGLDVETGTVFYSLFPLLIVVIGLWLTIGHLFAARIEWDRVWYAMTNKRLLVHRGLLRQHWSSLSLSELVWFRLSLSGPELGTVLVRSGREGERRLLLPCIEQPHRLTLLLEQVLRDNGHLADAEECGVRSEE